MLCFVEAWERRGSAVENTYWLGTYLGHILLNDSKYNDDVLDGIEKMEWSRCPVFRH